MSQDQHDQQDTGRSLISRLPIKTIAVGAIIATVGIAGTAGAASLVTSAQIKDGTVMNRDVHRGTISEDRLDGGVRAKLNKTGGVTISGANGANGKDGDHGRDGVDALGERGPKGEQGDKGDKGEKGDAVMAGAYQAVAKYNNANEGAIATVACKAETDTAISGGVRVIDPTRNTPVSSSFAGRMNWDTNSPKDNRLDGWIVQFGGNAGPVADKAPLRVDVFATCVPNLELNTHVTFSQVG